MSSDTTHGLSALSRIGLESTCLLACLLATQLSAFTKHIPVKDVNELYISQVFVILYLSCFRR